MDIESCPQLIAKVAERLAAMADENRVRLRRGECNLAALSIAQGSGSKQLGVLRRFGWWRSGAWGRSPST
jgi:hypothetical protein